MGSSFINVLCRFLIPILCMFVAYVHIVNSQSSTTSRAECIAACDGEPAVTLCANNGVTYPNMCRFNCVKARNKRLRVVKTGACQSVSLNDYRRGQQG